MSVALSEITFIALDHPFQTVHASISSFERNEAYEEREARPYLI